MTTYAIRITAAYDDLKGYVEKMAEVCDKLVVYEHTDVSRIHIHAYVENVTVSSDTLKNWVKKCLGVVAFPKSDWSFVTQLQGEEVKPMFITYMSKGVLRPKFIKGISTEDVDAYRLKWEDRRKPSPVSKGKETVTIYQMAEELYDWMKQQDKPTEFNHWSHVANKEILMSDVVNEAIKIHNRYRKAYCDYSLAKVIQTAVGMFDKHPFKQELIRKVMEKIMPRSM